ncbi:P-loop containing nucleoside triphosphate hydrolase protein [Tribonema minus]|uniref:Elongation factor Tu, chloroplastic n=1 Tax=Tribonema minus TaxID=303371 RepID=A0A835ZB77_9STRA|nr:P-loop containing nucleoside triphosphate hydrolase protein [Tribonema minus]
MEATGAVDITDGRASGGRKSKAASSSILNVNVGVLGHVDSGKTSLVRALSTVLSTAALDKHPQSRERGITLDLGFSAFTVPAPAAVAALCDSVQFTLVDCPGHASLIRTIIGGAQIIDMMLLVVDATKGMQTQTAECVVIGETTMASADDLVIVLNKADLMPEDEREARIARLQARMRRQLAGTKFARARFATVAAAPGGGGGGEGDSAQPAAPADAKQHTSAGVVELAELLRSLVRSPQRSDTGPFHMAVDHCFALRGQGTVLTGTVLSGAVEVGQMIELPELAITRKVKSMQVYRRPVQRAQQGDRVGVCVAGLDAALVERGVAAAPGALRPVRAAVAAVRAVKFFRGKCPSGGKLHVSTGHATVMATATYFGAAEMAAILVDRSPAQSEEQGTVPPPGALSDIPPVRVDWRRDFLQQPALTRGSDRPDSQAAASAATSQEGRPPLQFALLQFQTPVFAPPGGLVIGSKLDGDAGAQPAGGGAQRGTVPARAAAAEPSGGGGAGRCRICLYGRIVEAFGAGELDAARLRLYTTRERRGVIFRVGAAAGGGGGGGGASGGGGSGGSGGSGGAAHVHEVFGRDLFGRDSRVAAYVGMIVEGAQGEVGRIEGTFGQAGKFRARFPLGIAAKVGTPLRTA